mmetsp:Transcript_11361/g.36026  ORF Transcript_11361/g.36026 Transcript_11361/m.36026 type:complete len:331 (-) Transcript_11361:666-1658(-)
MQRDGGTSRRSGTFRRAPNSEYRALSFKCIGSFGESLDSSSMKFAVFASRDSSLVNLVLQLVYASLKQLVLCRMMRQIQAKSGQLGLAATLHGFKLGLGVVALVSHRVEFGQDVTAALGRSFVRTSGKRNRTTMLVDSSVHSVSRDSADTEVSAVVRSGCETFGGSRSVRCLIELHEDGLRRDRRHCNLHQRKATETSACGARVCFDLGCVLRELRVAVEEVLYDQGHLVVVAATLGRFGIERRREARPLSFGSPRGLTLGCSLVDVALAHRRATPVEQIVDALRRPRRPSVRVLPSKRERVHWLRLDANGMELLWLLLSALVVGSLAAP